MSGLFLSPQLSWRQVHRRGTDSAPITAQGFWEGVCSKQTSSQGRGEAGGEDGIPGSRGGVPWCLQSLKPA